MRNNGFYLRQVAGDSWLLMRGDYPVNQTKTKDSYIYPIKLNATGAYIWEQIELGYAIDDIAENIQREYGISFKEAQSDVEDYVESLVQKGCLYVE